jgi:hypothetical protein
MSWRPRVRRGRGFTAGTGSATSSGGGLDQSQSVAAITRIFDLTGTSRPVSVDIRVGAGDSIEMHTTTVPAAIYDEAHPSWTVARATSGANTIESVTNRNVVGVRVRRTAGSSTTSTVRVFCPVRGSGYNPVYNPSYDAAPAGLNDTRRFLDQCTMGPLALEAASFSGTYGAWLQQQVDAPAPTVTPLLGPESNSPPYWGASRALFKFWLEHSASNALRVRVAHALSQIVVAGPGPGGSGNSNMHSWHQGLVNLALSNYRDILNHACVHRAMGFYLNNLANSAWNIAPSQNFARELLQLFSTGANALNKDGTEVRDGTGALVRAYSQTDVGAAARYLSGWYIPFPLGHRPGELGSPANGNMVTSKSLSQNLAFNGDTTPWPFFGRTSADYPAFATLADPSDAQIIARKDAVIDVIMQQPSVGPYICKQLIQKLVTDSPTPQYVRRVVASWDNNGSGVVGDLRAVVRAILLDAEARGNSKPVTFGRAQEMTLSITRRMRYAQVQTHDIALNQMWVWATFQGSPPPMIVPKMGQLPAWPVSVFNDYPFSFTAIGVEAPAAALWNSTSIQANSGIAMSYSSSLASPVAMGTDDPIGRWNVTDLIAVYDAAFAADPGGTPAKVLAGHTALMNRAYADLHQGDLPTTVEQTEILALLADLNGQSLTTRARCCWLVNFLTAISRAAIVK